MNRKAPRTGARSGYRRTMVSYRLPEDVLADLKRLSSETGIPQTRLIENAVALLTSSEKLAQIAKLRREAGFATARPANDAAEQSRPPRHAGRP